MPVSSITDWISSLSSLAATIIGGVTAYLGYRQYLQKPVQETEPSEAVDEGAEPATTELLVFKTSKQKTWLKASETGIECRIDDTRPGKGGRQWILSKSEVREILSKKDFRVDPGYKSRTGLFTLGRRRNWLYSKQLFPEPHFLRGALVELMEKVK